MPDLPQVVQARDRQRIAHQPGGQVRRHRLPVAGQKHCGKMTARRVARHRDARRIAAVLGHMSPRPGQDPDHLQRDLGNGDRRSLGAGAQRVVGQRDEGMIALSSDRHQPPWMKKSNGALALAPAKTSSVSLGVLP
jgi:hypothetical protein